MKLFVHGAGLVYTADAREPADLARLREIFPGPALRRIPKLVRMALLAATDALDMAQWRTPEILENTALVVGSAYGCQQMSLDFMDSILDNGPQLSSPTAFSHSVNNVLTGLVSLHLGMHGPCMNVTQFEHSFAGAVQAATALLASKRAGRVLLGMADECDPRFARCCPAVAQAGMAEGAVFFCLGLERKGLPEFALADAAPTALAHAVATFRALA